MHDAGLANFSLAGKWRRSLGSPIGQREGTIRAHISFWRRLWRGSGGFMKRRTRLERDSPSPAFHDCPISTGRHGSLNAAPPGTAGTFAAPASGSLRMTAIIAPNAPKIASVTSRPLQPICKDLMISLCRRRRIMAAKEISVKKYVVRLSGDEREQLEALDAPLFVKR